jgi:peptidoglycan-N-acetylglucosamine deacetylase
VPPIDDGPDPVYTPQVLRRLEKYQVTAIFSMIGIEVDAHPAWCAMWRPLVT